MNIDHALLRGATYDGLRRLAASLGLRVVGNHATLVERVSVALRREERWAERERWARQLGAL